MLWCHQLQTQPKHLMVRISSILTSSVSTQLTFQLSVEHIQQTISGMPNTTNASIPQSTLTSRNVGCLNIGQVPTQQMTILTQPMYSSYLQMPTNIVKTYVPIPTTAYQYIGQSGTLPPPPPHNMFRNPYKYGGGFINSQQSQMKSKQDLA